MSRRLTILAFVFCLPSAVAGSAFASSAPTMMQSAMAWYLAGFQLGPWESYLARELTPELDFVEPVDVPTISWLAIDHDIVLPEFARPLLSDPATPRLSVFQVGFQSATLQDQLIATPEGQQLPGFQRATVLSGMAGQLSSRNQFSVSAVLASQQFSHSMLDLAEFDGEFRPVDFSSTHRELSTGAGLQLGFASELAPRLMLNASYQSRVNMDELASVRGVHGYSADLDIPSRVQMALDMQAGSQTLFTVAVSQVFYSEVGAFPSRSLPARFNALLGDSSSPSFEWKDLTVYTVGMRWKHESELEFSLNFHSRSQPTPSAASLSAALSDELGQHSVLMGIGKRIGDRARFDVSASYAPPEFAFGGNVLGVVSDRLDQAVEVAARFNLRF
jgi:long-chain fatty acid transport protein